MSQLTEKPTHWQEEAQRLAEVLCKVKTFCDKRRETDHDDVAAITVLRIISENLNLYTHCDSSGMLWRFDGARPVSALADQVMRNCGILPKTL